MGATQLSFPLYEADEGEALTPPESVVHQVTQTSPKQCRLEAYESSIVTLENAFIPSNFGELRGSTPTRLQPIPGIRSVAIETRWMEGAACMSCRMPWCQA